MFKSFLETSPEFQESYRLHIENARQSYRASRTSTRRPGVNIQTHRLPSPSPSISATNIERNSTRISESRGVETVPIRDRFSKRWPLHSLQPIIFPLPTIDKAKTITEEDSTAEKRPRSPEPHLSEEQPCVHSTPVSASPRRRKHRRQARNHLQPSTLSKTTRYMKRRVTRRMLQSKGPGSGNPDLWELDQNGCPRRTAK